MKKIIDIKKFIIGLQTPLIEAIAGLNKRADGHQFLLVVDSKEKLVGTVTDGDIRRALLAGHPMSTPVREFMNSSPRSMLNSRNEVDMLAELNNRVFQITFLPILKSNGTVDCVLLNSFYDLTR